MALLAGAGDRKRLEPLEARLGGVGISMEIRPLSAGESGPGVLCLTDSAEEAAWLQEQGVPVLGWRHDGADLEGVQYLCECLEELEPRYLERVYRRFRDIPWEILETERCVLRETTEADVDSFFEIYSHPDIVRYTEELYPEKERERAYIREYRDRIYRYYEFGVWTVVWKETGEVIGRAGFDVRAGYDLPELGFVIGAPWQGRGVAREICSAILRYGETEFGFERVQALVQPENAPSLALCRRLGFQRQRTVQEAGKQYDYLVRFTTDPPVC